MNENIKCPNNWDDCSHCLYQTPCMHGALHIEDNTAVQQAAEICEQSTQEEAVKSAKIIKRDLHSEFMRMSPDEGLKEFYRFKLPNLHQKEIMPLDGPSSPGGGGSGKVKKSKKGNKPTIYVWGETS